MLASRLLSLNGRRSLARPRPEKGVAQNSVQSASFAGAAAAEPPPKADTSFWPSARAGEERGRDVASSATRAGATGRSAGRGAGLAAARDEDDAPPLDPPLTWN